MFLSWWLTGPRQTTANEYAKSSSASALAHQDNGLCSGVTLASFIKIIVN